MLDYFFLAELYLLVFDVLFTSFMAILLSSTLSFLNSSSIICLLCCASFLSGINGLNIHNLSYNMSLVWYYYSELFLLISLFILLAYQKIDNPLLFGNGQKLMVILIISDRNSYLKYNNECYFSSFVLSLYLAFLLQHSRSPYAFLQ